MGSGVFLRPRLTSVALRSLRLYEIDKSLILRRGIIVRKAGARVRFQNRSTKGWKVSNDRRPDT